MLPTGLRAHRTNFLIVTIVALVVGVSGCADRPDLRNRADDIGGVLSVMPGVSDLKTIYQNGFDSGQDLKYEVTMEMGATNDQVADVATRLNSYVGDEFDDYNRTLKFIMHDVSMTIRGKPDVDELRQRLHSLERLQATIPAGAVEWEENDNEDTDYENAIEIRNDTEDPFTVISAVRDHLGSAKPLLRFEGQDDWTVKFPYSPAAQDKLASALEPVAPALRKMEIEKDHVTEVKADLDDNGPDVTSRLSALIDQLNRGSSGPWRFRWSTPYPSPNPDDLISAGVVSVRSCEYYDEAGEDPNEGMTQEAIAVQNQLRAKYDTCG